VILLDVINQKRHRTLISWKDELQNELHALQDPINSLQEEIEMLNIRLSYLYDSFSDEIRIYYADNLKARVAQKTEKLEELKEKHDDEIQMIIKTIGQVKANFEAFE
jgi:prefoldin subunit 5